MSQQQERAVLVTQRLAAAFNATRHMSLEQIRGGVVAQEGGQP